MKLKYKIISGLFLLGIFIMSKASAQSLTYVRMEGGITAVRYPVSCGNATLQQTFEKNIEFKVKNTSQNTITRALRLYMMPLPSGTPMIVWDGLYTFAPLEVLTFNRNNSPQLGNIVTENIGSYRLELRGSNSTIASIRPTSPLVPGVSGRNPVQIKVISADCKLTLLSLSKGISATTYPLSAGPRILQRNVPKNISFSIRNIGSGTNTRALRLYSIPLPSGTPVVLWEKVVSFTPNQTLTFDQNNEPALGGICLDAVGQYRFELRGSDVPDITTVTLSCPLVPPTTVSQNPVVIDVVECGDYLTDVQPPNPNVCYNDSVTISTPLVSGYIYQWRRDGIDIPGANADTFSAKLTGVYDVKVSRYGCPEAISPTRSTITVQPQIIASIIGLNPTYTNLAQPVTMTGSPMGGTFSGPGVSGNIFDPYVAGVGTHTITYSGNWNGCPYTITKEIIVTLDPCNTPIWWSGHTSIHERFYETLDINGDGKKDVLTNRTHSNPGKLSFLFNNGNGFDPPVTFDVDQFIIDQITENYGGDFQHHYRDFDNDGNKDFLISFSDLNWCSYSNFRIYWGIPTYPYFDPNSYTTLGANGNCSTSWAINFDGDDDHDVYIESAFASSRVYRNDGGRVFTHITNHNTSRDVTYSNEDWDQDGKEDLLAGDYGIFDADWGIKFYKSNGDGTFAAPIVYHAAEKLCFSRRIQAQPLDNNQLDFAASPQIAGNTKMLYIGTWDPNISGFNITSQQVLTDQSVIIRIMDWNDDGYEDVITRQATVPEKIFVNYNDGHGNFASYEQIFESTTSYPLYVDDLGNACKHIFIKKNANDSILILNHNPRGIRYFRTANIMNEKGDIALTLYPNPVRTEANINFTVDAVLPMQFEIIDVMGKKHLTQEGISVEGKNEIQINMENMAIGVYFLRAKIGDQTQTVKLIVE